MDTISILPNVIHTSIRYKSISRINNISNNIYHIHSRKRSKICAVEQVSAVVSDPVSPELTWQIVVGSTAGVIPFVVAGIEFSKRIVAQKKCVECGGSGLVLIEKEYIRCPNCGGFLPWQSWKRFFSG